MEKASDFYGKEKIFKIFLKIAPPVMLAQVIQALYNIVDSLFIGRYSNDGLTALSIVYPLQLLMIALAVGSGVGIKTLNRNALKAVTTPQGFNRKAVKILYDTLSKNRNCTYQDDLEPLENKGLDIYFLS